MTTIVWTKDAHTLTWPCVERGTPHEFESRVLTNQSAGGQKAGLNTGQAGEPEREFLDYLFPRITKAQLADFTTWRKTVSVGSLNSFANTDNTKSPAEVSTVWMQDFSYVKKFYEDPASPLFEVRVRLRKA
jgi:hypothetical protein